MKKEAKAADAQQMLRTLLEAGVSLAEAFPSPPPPPPAPPRRIKKLIPSQPRLTFVFPGTSSGAAAGAAAGSKRSRISTGTDASDEEEEEEEEEEGAGERSVGAHSVFGSVVKYPRSGSKVTQVRGSSRPDSPPRQLPFQVNSVVRPAAPPPHPEPGARSPEPGARSPEPGARSPEPGARSPEPATRCRPHNCTRSTHLSTTSFKLEKRKRLGTYGRIYSNHYSLTVVIFASFCYIFSG